MRVGSCGWSASLQQLQEWGGNVIKLPLNFNDRSQAGKRDMLSSLTPWLFPPSVPSLSYPMEYIQSASVCNSLTMKYYDRTNVSLPQLYCKYGGNVTGTSKKMAGCVEKESWQQEGEMKELKDHHRFNAWAYEGSSPGPPAS